MTRAGSKTDYFFTDERMTELKFPNDVEDGCDSMQLSSQQMRSVKH